MNGADMLCDVLLANGVDMCFANPGTSEMHFVAALDRKPAMRCVLGLFEGVVTGAADGYARMADKPAATLLHLGPGLANGLANLHNARRARTPVINVVGDHAGHHLANDAPLTSDIDSLARPMSHWVGRATTAGDVRACAEQAYIAAVMQRAVATMILPADAAWGDLTPQIPVPVALPARPGIAPDALARAGAALRSGRRVALVLQGRALREDALLVAGRIASATGATLFSQVSDRMQRGAGRVAAQPIPYGIDLAVETLRGFEVAICLCGRQPVAFFAYPGKPGTVLPPACEVIELASPEQDPAAALEALAAEAGVPEGAAFARNRFTQHEIPLPNGALTADAVNAVVARALPENAILVNEAITSGAMMDQLAPGLHPHDQLQLTGGAIGAGIPLATGAALACPQRRVIALQADGSGMYTLQGLWTQARERLDIVTVVLANRSYAILQGEMRNVGVEHAGRSATRMLTLEDPTLDWCSLARGMGVEAARCETVRSFADTFAAALSGSGPFLIEATI